MRSGLGVLAQTWPSVPPCRCCITCSKQVNTKQNTHANLGRLATCGHLVQLSDVCLLVASVLLPAVGCLSASCACCASNLAQGLLHYRLMY